MDLRLDLCVLVCSVIHVASGQNLEALLRGLTGFGGGGNDLFQSLRSSSSAFANSGGSSASAASSGCPYEPHPDRLKFSQRVNAQTFVRSCAPGTMYDAGTCGCVTLPKGQPGVNVGGGNPRFGAPGLSMPGAGGAGMSMINDLMSQLQNQAVRPPSPAQPSTGRRSHPAPPRLPTQAPARPQPPQPQSSTNRRMGQSNPSGGIPLDSSFMTYSPKTIKRFQSDGVPLYKKVPKLTNPDTDPLAELLIELSKLKDRPQPTPTTPPPLTDASDRTSSIFTAPGLSSSMQNAPRLTSSTHDAPGLTSSTHDAQGLTSSMHGALDQTAQKHGGQDPLSLMFGGQHLTSSMHGTPGQTAQIHGGQDPTSSMFGGQHLTSSMHGTPGQTAQIHGGQDPTSSMFGGQHLTPSTHGAPGQTAQIHRGQDPTSSMFGGQDLMSSMFGGQDLMSSLFGAPGLTSSMFGGQDMSSMFGNFGGGAVRGLGGAMPGMGGSMPGMGGAMGGMGGSMGAMGGMGGAMGGMGGADIASLLGALGGGGMGGAGGGAAGGGMDMSALLAGFGGGGAGMSGGRAQNPFSALGGNLRTSSLFGSQPSNPDMTSLFNMQGKMQGASALTGLANIDMAKLQELDRQGIIDIGDLSPAGAAAASRHFQG